MDLEKVYLYRMTHIDNVAHLLIHGITHKDSVNANPDFTPIGDNSLISSRGNFNLGNGRTLGEYIPFYFGTRTPMLFVIQNGFNGVTPTLPQNIVYCVSSVQKILDAEMDFIFTDGHAIDLFTNQFTPADVPDLETLIDFAAVKARDWNSGTDLDLKRRKQAEFLLSGDLPFKFISGFIVYNENAKNRLLQIGVPENQIHINNNAYF